MSLLTYLGIQILFLCLVTGIGIGLSRRTGVSSLLPALGFVALLAMLPLIHLLVPMRWEVGCLLLVLGFGGWIYLPRDRGSMASAGKFLAAFLLVQVIIAWPLAMNVALQYDWGLYYQQSQKWASACPAVPGLGNLHARYAFPGSSFLLAGLFDSLVGEGWGSRILGGFLVGLVLTTLVSWTIHSARKSAGFLLGFAAVSLPFFSVALEISVTAVAAPDLLSGGLLLLLGGHLLRESERVDRSLDDFLLFFGVGLVALRLTNAPFVVVLLGLSALRGWRPSRSSMALSAIFVAGWLVRNWILSGFPVFPYGFSAPISSWTMDGARVQDMQESIKAWARAPGPDSRQAMDGWRWLDAWWHRMASAPLILEVLALTSLGSMGWIFHWRRNRVRFPRALVTLLGGVLASIASWFLAAPDLRIAMGSFWLLGAVGAGLLVESVPSRRARLALAAMALIPLVPFLRDVADIRIAPLQPKSAVLDVRLPSGLVVHIPAHGDQVWNAPLPATPEITDLIPRGPSLCDGFRDGGRPLRLASPGVYEVAPAPPARP